MTTQELQVASELLAMHGIEWPARPGGEPPARPRPRRRPGPALDDPARILLYNMGIE